VYEQNFCRAEKASFEDLFVRQSREHRVLQIFKNVLAPINRPVSSNWGFADLIFMVNQKHALFSKENLECKDVFSFN